MKMNYITLLAVLTAVVLATGCDEAALVDAAGAGETPEQVADQPNAGEEGEAETAESLVAEVTPPGEPVDQEPDVVPGYVVEDDVAVSGEFRAEPGIPVEPEPAAGEEGSEDVVESEEPVKSSIPETWGTYRNPDYGFAIDVPPEWTLLAGNAQIQPQPLAQFEFRSDVEAPGPPELSIRVYDNAAGQALETWLQEQGVLSRFGGGAQTESISLGGSPAIRVTSAMLIAPGRAVFVARDDYVYELTPLIPAAEQALDTFRFE